MSEEFDLLGDEEGLLPENSLLDDRVAEQDASGKELRALEPAPIAASGSLTSDDLLSGDLDDLLPDDPLGADADLLANLNTEESTSREVDHIKEQPSTVLTSVNETGYDLLGPDPLGSDVDLLPDNPLATEQPASSPISLTAESGFNSNPQVKVAIAPALGGNSFNQTSEAQSQELPKIRRRTTIQQVLKVKRAATRSEIAKGVVFAGTLGLFLLGIEVLAYTDRLSEFLPSKESQTIDPQIISYEAKPLRLLGGKELLLVKGKVNLGTEKTENNVAHYQVEVTLLANDKESVLAKQRVALGTTYSQAQLEELSKNGNVLGPFANTRDNRFEAALTLNELKEPLSLLDNNPERLRLTVIAP